MDPNIITILIYIGIILLIGLVKSIGGAGKSKKRPVRLPEKRESFPQQSNVPSGASPSQGNVMVTRSGKTTESERHVTVESAGYTEVGDFYKKTSAPDAHASRTEDEKEFILGEFDLKSAIVYSEILKRPDY